MKLYLTTIRLSDMKNVEKRPFLQVLRDPRDMINGVHERDAGFKKRSKHIYKNIFEFIESEDIKINVIISGDIIQNLYDIDNKTFKLFKKLVESKNILLIADSYYSESNTSFYYQIWWRDSIARTFSTCKELLGTTPKIAFVPMYFRSLELEILTKDTGIKEFLTVGKTIKRNRFFRQQLSEFRRYNGNSPTWIDENKDVKCTFHYIPSSHFFNINRFLLGPLSGVNTKAVIMGIGSMIFRLKVIAPQTRSGGGYNPRVPEYVSMSEYNDLQRSVMRLWEYISKLTLSEYRLHDSEFIKKMYHTIGRIQNTDYLLYCLKEMYQQDDLDFTSPYEFFANTQALVENVLILLKNKL